MSSKRNPNAIDFVRASVVAAVWPTLAGRASGSLPRVRRRFRLKSYHALYAVALMTNACTQSIHYVNVQNTERALEQRLQQTPEGTRVDCTPNFFHNWDALVCRTNVQSMQLSGIGLDASGAFLGEHNAILLSQSADQSVRDHEERHSRQRIDPADIRTTADEIMAATYMEADARVHQIIRAYQSFLRTGDTRRWQHMVDAEPDMVNLFDGLVREDPASIARLRSGRDPSPEIMRRTALSYVMSESALAYLHDNYYVALGEPELAVVLGLPDAERQAHVERWVTARDNFRSMVGSSPITLTPEKLARGLRRHGIDYLYDPAMPELNPMNPDIYTFLTRAPQRGEHAAEWQAAHERCERHYAEPNQRRTCPDSPRHLSHRLAVQALGLRDVAPQLAFGRVLGAYPLHYTEAQAAALQRPVVARIEGITAATRHPR